jgi:hypothetical protein
MRKYPNQELKSHHRLRKVGGRVATNIQTRICIKLPLGKVKLVTGIINLTNSLTSRLSKKSGYRVRVNKRTLKGKGIN